MNVQSFSPRKEIASVELRKQTKNGPPPSNTVRMDLDKLNALFDEMEQRNPSAQQDPRRSHVRWNYRQLAVRVQVVHRAGSQASFHVACRNLSSGGMSVLHSSFLHTGTRIIVTLTHVSGHSIEVEGTVARCIHIQGVCHEIGIKFSQPVDARNFVKLDLIEDAFVLEKVAPESLEGVVVYIAGTKEDETIMGHFLRDSRVRLRVANSMESALAQLDDQTDLLICDHPVNEQSAADIIEGLRAQGRTHPAIIVAADTSPGARAKFVQAEISTFLPKPLEQNTLMRALAEFMASDKDMGAAFSSLPRNHPNMSKLDGFIKEANAQGVEIEKAIRDNDYPNARKLVGHMLKVAPTMGFHKLAQVAQLADQALNSTMSVEESRSQLGRLAQICGSVRRKAA